MTMYGSFFLYIILHHPDTFSMIVVSGAFLNSIVIAGPTTESILSPPIISQAF
jgi:hypothetical protein